jgi:hypothetical protein
MQIDLMGQGRFWASFREVFGRVIARGKGKSEVGDRRSEVGSLRAGVRGRRDEPQRSQRDTEREKGNP